MIKKSIKSFNFVEDKITINTDVIAGQVLMVDMDGGFTWQQPPNDWTVRLDIPNHPDPQFVLHADGDAIFTGRVHSLGSVMWNQVLNRLEFWDGTNWIPINT